MRMLLAGLVLLLAWGCEAAGGGEGAGDEETVRCAILTAGMGHGWADLNHRVSVLSVEPAIDDCGAGGSVRTTFVGGDFSTGETMTDLPSFRFSGTRVSGATGVGFHVGSVALRGRGAEALMAETVTVDLAEAHLEGFGSYHVVIAGLELRTDVAQDVDYPEDYDPAHGYTTRGFGAELSSVERGDGALVFTATLHVRWGPSDRPDMNAALDEAAVEGVLHYLVVGMDGGAVSEAGGSYRREYPRPEPLVDTPQEPADETLTRQTCSLDPDFAPPVPGWRAFDFVLDPDLDAGPESGEPIGYYLREWWLEAAVVDWAVDTGEARVDVAGHVSNASSFIAYYPLVMDFTGSVLLFQFPAETDLAPVSLDETFETGEATFPL